MTAIPTIETERLRLRPFTLNDAPDVQRLAGDAKVAATTLRIPHPYPNGEAEKWIGKHEDTFENGKGLPLAIARKSDDCLLGAIGLEINEAHRNAEIGYWIGVPYWGNGYATEAARAVVAYAFETMKLHRVFAHHMVHNAGSGKVLANAGMQQEGVLRQHIFKNSEFIDIALCGMTRAMYDAAR